MVAQNKEFCIMFIVMITILIMDIRTITIDICITSRVFVSALFLIMFMTIIIIRQGTTMFRFGCRTPGYGRCSRSSPVRRLDINPALP